MIEDLGADHERLGDLARRVRTAIDAGDREAAHDALDDLITFLRHHTELEEASVFAALRAAGEMSDHVEALAADHAAVWDAVAALDDVDDWNARVLTLLDDLHEHIAREEYDLFPATLVALAPADWDAVEAAAREVRASAH